MPRAAAGCPSWRRSSRPSTPARSTPTSASGSPPCPGLHPDFGRSHSARVRALVRACECARVCVALHPDCHPWLTAMPRSARARVRACACVRECARTPSRAHAYARARTPARTARPWEALFLASRCSPQARKHSRYYHRQKGRYSEEQTEEEDKTVGHRLSIIFV